MAFETIEALKDALRLQGVEVDTLKENMEDLQIQIYKLVFKAVNNSYAPLIDSIIRDKRYLDRSDIAHDIYIYFFEKDYLNRFDPEKGKLSTFVYRFVKWGLFSLRRKKGNPEINFSDLSRLDDNGELQDFEIMDFNTPEKSLLEKTKEKNIKQLRSYVLGKRR